MRGVRLLIVSSALSYQLVLFEAISTVGSLQGEIVIRTTKVGGLDTERPIENKMQNIIIDSLWFQTQMFYVGAIPLVT